MTISKERELLILFSRAKLFDKEKRRIEELLEERLDWQEILYQGTTHRVLNLVYYHLNALNKLECLEKDLKNLFKLHFNAIGVKNRIYFSELGDIAREFSKYGIKAALLKGPLLANSIYPAHETRYFNDLDFLIKMKDVPKITEILNSLGFIQGQYNEIENTIKVANKRQKIFHQMSTHELQEFIKLKKESVVNLIEVDMNHNILWVGNCSYTVDNEALIDRAIEVDIFGEKVWRLNYEDCLVQLCCHLFREATLLHWVEDLRDLKIYKFADIYIYIKEYSAILNWDKFISYVKEFNLEKIVYYVFYYVNLIYTECVEDSIMKSIEPEDKEYLDQYGIENEIPKKWNHDFFTRLFDINRVLEVIKESDNKTSFEVIKENM